MDFFKAQFQEEARDHKFSLLHKITKMISDEDNERFIRLPDNSEVKKIVYE